MFAELAFVAAIFWYRMYQKKEDQPMLDLDYDPIHGLPGKVDKLHRDGIETFWPLPSHPEMNRFEPGTIVESDQYVEKYSKMKYDVVYNKKNVFMDDTMMDRSSKPKRQHFFAWIPMKTS